MSVIDALKWRAAIKQFDTTKKVSDHDLEKLIEAANLAATSGGLQPFKLVVIKDEALKQKLQAASYNQAAVGDSSHLLVFAVQTNSGNQLIDAYLHRVVEVRGVEMSSLEGYRQSMNGYVGNLDEASRLAWATKQAYISLGTLLSAAADLKIDATPMEGFELARYEEILGLKAQGLVPVVMAAVGYRSSNDVYSAMPKVRKKRNDFVVEIN
jgi:nitroreductase